MSRVRSPRPHGHTAALVCAAWTLGAALPAEAGLAECGDIHVEAMATCEVLVECAAMCEPFSVRAACAARLHAECDVDCAELPSIDCAGACQADCQARCGDFEPGAFDCRADCQADCSGDCSAHCESAENSTECEASCTASCDAHCEGSCSVEPPAADCDASCEASCEGSCTADANLDCQIDCQTYGFAQCEAEVRGGCEVACESDEGALFCDGQYVDHGDNLQQCIDALEAALDLQVETHAEAQCSDGQCEARASASVSSSGLCSASSGRGGATSGALLLAGVLPLALRRRRSRAG